MPYIKVTLNTDIWNTSQIQRSKRGINFTTLSRLPLLYNVIIFSVLYSCSWFPLIFAVGGKKQFSLLPLSSFKSDSRSNISPPLFIPCLAGTNLPQMSSDTLISVIANILFKIYLWNVHYTGVIYKSMFLENQMRGTMVQLGNPL